MIWPETLEIPQDDGARVELLWDTNDAASTDEEAVIEAVSRLQSGRSIVVSQLMGDLVMRVAEGCVALEVLESGRRSRLEIAKSNIHECQIRVDDDDDRKLECGACGLRFGARRHLEAHVEFHDQPVCPVSTRSSRVRIVLAESAPVIWRRETSVDPTRLGSWHGAAATWEVVPRYRDPFFDEINRTRVITMRLRSETSSFALNCFAESVMKQSRAPAVLTGTDEDVISTNPGEGEELWRPSTEQTGC